MTVLGSGTLEPYLRRGSSAHAVEVGEDLLFFDMGPGALRSALACGLDPRRARHLFFSHLHPDHTAELVPLLFARNCSPDWKSEEPLHFHGPAGLGDFLEALAVPFRWTRPRGWERCVHEAVQEPFGRPGWMARAFPVEHGEDPAVAWRLEAGGRVFCYSGDSGSCEGLVQAAQAADLLLCECSTPEGAPPLEAHLSSAEVGHLASRAGVGRVVLCHLRPAADEVDVAAQVRRFFHGQVDKAEDGSSWEL